MDNLYNTNGLVFWTEQEIKLRETIKDYLISCISNNLKKQNRAFEIIQVEAPQLTPRQFINKNYTDQDVFVVSEELVLRPETTMGTYKALEHFLNPHNDRKMKLPLCVFQHGKSFRQEQDQATKFMRLKEFYQLEFQIAFSPSTATDYSIDLIPVVQKAISDMIGECENQPSDRLPDYSEQTTDIICKKETMEVCSISKRNDFSGGKVLEIAIGTDRCVYCFMNK